MATFNTGHIRQLVQSGNSVGDQFLDDNMGSGIGGGSGGGGNVVSNVSVVQDSYYATISWTTSLATTLRIDYGTTTSYGNFVQQGAVSTSHSIVINRGGAGLTQNQLYHYKIGNVAGTLIDSDRTFTTVRLKAPPLNFGPYIGLQGLAPFADTLTNLNGGTINPNIGSPSKHNFNITAGTLRCDPAYNLDLWGDTMSLQCGSTFDSSGEAGLDGFDGSCFIGGGGGGSGASGGGGGGSTDNPCGGSSGGSGGFGGDSGTSGSSEGQGSGGSGGFGYGFEYDGTDIGIVDGLYPQAGGNGGGGCGGIGAGGGGGGSGKQQNLVFNHVHSCNGGALLASGGSGGLGYLAGFNGDAGTGGSIVLFARKYDGSLGGYDANYLYLVEVIGTSAAGWSYVVHPQGEYGVGWDHLYQP